jgi:hypothetical protein
VKLTSEEAFDLSKGIRDISACIGDYRFKNWRVLSKSQRRSLEDIEWSLLNLSSDVLTSAVGLILDESKCDVDRLVKLTSSARKTLIQLEDTKKAVGIAAAVLGLAAAIVSKDIEAIAKNAESLHKVVTGATNPGKA